VRKLIAFDDETFTALKLLKKHGRPTDLKDALKQSLRRMPANDRGTSRAKTSKK
jgi:hypothetical protein